MTSLVTDNGDTDDASSAYAYIFVCNNQTEQRCLQGLLGSPSKDFKKMKDTIADDTMLFLFNFSSKKLFGPFHKHGKIQMNIDPVAWTGFKQGKKQPPPKKKKSRFPAQVRIKSWASKNNFLTSATPFRVTDIRVIPKGGGAIMRNTISTPLKVLLDSQKRAAETGPDSMVLLKKQQSNKHDAKESVLKDTTTAGNNNTKKNITLQELREQRAAAAAIPVETTKKSEKKKKSVNKESFKWIDALSSKTQNLLIKEMQELSLLHGTLDTPVVTKIFQKTFSLKKNDVPQYFSWFDSQKCKFAWSGTACKFGNKCRYIHPLNPTKKINSKVFTNSTSNVVAQEKENLSEKPSKSKKKKNKKKNTTTKKNNKDTKTKQKNKNSKKVNNDTTASHVTDVFSHIGNEIGTAMIATTEDNFEEEVGDNLELEYDPENPDGIINELKSMFHEGEITLVMFEETLEELVEEKIITRPQLRYHVDSLLNDTARKNAPRDSKPPVVTAIPEKKKENTWKCPSCTFENTWQDIKCSMCLRTNPEKLVKSVKEKLNSPSDSFNNNNNVNRGSKQNERLISRTNSNNPQMFKVDQISKNKKKKKQSPSSSRLRTEAKAFVPKGFKPKKQLTAKQIQNRVYNRRQEIVRQDRTIHNLKKKCLKKMIEYFNEPARRKRRKKLKSKMAKMAKHRKKRLVHNMFSNWKKWMETDDFLASKRKRQEEEANRLAAEKKRELEEEEEMKRELESKRAKLEAAKIAAEEKERKKIENRRKKKEARLRRRREKRDNTANFMLPLLYATCVGNIESVLKEDDAVSSIFQLFVTSNQALETSYQQMIKESEKSEEFSKPKAETESEKKNQATLIYFNAGLLCSDLLEIFQMAYEYGIKNDNTNRKGGGTDNNVQFIPKYKVECYLMELNKLVDIEFTYTEFEELREIGKIDDVSNTEKINIINSMIKKRREEEKRIAEARRQKAIKKAIEAEKKRIREEQKAKDDAERRKMEAERRRIERERRRKEKIAEEKERQRRMKEAKARAKAAKRERQRRQHQFFDFEEDMADAFFEEMFRRRFAGSFFFGNRGFGGGHYYDPGEENREKLKKKKLAAYELFELPDEASEADVNRAYKKKALRYHPDKWNERLGISKEEGMEKFKMFSNARDDILAYNDEIAEDERDEDNSGKTYKHGYDDY